MYRVMKAVAISLGVAALLLVGLVVAAVVFG
jgi:hypothetical protein